VVVIGADSVARKCTARPLRRGALVVGRRSGNARW
jgi:hypothetical protein